MGQWRNIPTAYKWDGDSVTFPKEVAPPVVKPPAVSTGIPVTSASALVIQNPVPTVTANVCSVLPKPEPTTTVPVNIPGLSTEEQAAAAKMEAALDNVLALLGQKQEVIQDSSNLATGSAGPPLWDNQIQELMPAGSPIYPDGRPVTNPNHLMLFLWNGAEIVRSYTTTGWKSKVRRQDGKLNPVPESLVEAITKAGYLSECGNGVYKIKLN